MLALGQAKVVASSDSEAPGEASEGSPYAISDGGSEQELEGGRHNSDRKLGCRAASGGGGGGGARVAPLADDVVRQQESVAALLTSSVLALAEVPMTGRDYCAESGAPKRTVTSCCTFAEALARSRHHEEAQGVATGAKVAMAPVREAETKAKAKAAQGGEEEEKQQQARQVATTVGSFRVNKCAAEPKGRDEEPDQAGRLRAASGASTASDDDAETGASGRRSSARHHSSAALATTSTGAPPAISAETTMGQRQLQRKEQFLRLLRRRRRQIGDKHRGRRRSKAGALVKRLLASVGRELDEAAKQQASKNHHKQQQHKPEAELRANLLLEKPELQDKNQHDSFNSEPIVMMDNLVVINAPNQRRNQMQHSDGESSPSGTSFCSSISSPLPLDLLTWKHFERTCSASVASACASGATRGECSEPAGCQRQLETTEQRLLFADTMFEPCSSSGEDSADELAKPNLARRPKQNSETSVLVMMQHLTRRRNELKVIDERLMGMLNSCLDRLETGSMSASSTSVTGGGGAPEAAHMASVVGDFGAEQQQVAIDLSVLGGALKRSACADAQRALHPKKVRLLKAAAPHLERQPATGQELAAVLSPLQQLEQQPAASWAVPLSLVVEPGVQHCAQVNAQQPHNSLQAHYTHTPQLFDYIQGQLALPLTGCASGALGLAQLHLQQQQQQHSFGAGAPHYTEAPQAQQQRARPTPIGHSTARQLDQLIEQQAHQNNQQVAAELQLPANNYSQQLELVIASQQQQQQRHLASASDLIMPIMQKMSSFQCHVCHSCFEDRHRLQQHLSIHLELHPSWFEERTIKETMAQYELRRGDYLCQLCQLRFETTAEFDKHMQLHGDKPHQCELCQQTSNKLVSFRHFRQLLTHLRSHCFLYSCKFAPECKQTANRKDYLKLHILKHHLNNKLPEQQTICCH